MQDAGPGGGSRGTNDAGSPTIAIALPSWVAQEVARHPACGSVEARMELAIALAERNVASQTGGPFGAAVFDLDGPRLISVGVNLVETSGFSHAHAEVVALALAQRALGRFDLAHDGATTQLVTSTEPCAMCLGAVCWSGVRELVCGARGADAEAIGFDEGPKPVDWREECEQRGIRLHCDVLRERAVKTLRAYQQSGGRIYNPSGRSRSGSNSDSSSDSSSG